MKRLWRELACQASLSQQGPTSRLLPGNVDEEQDGPVDAAPSATATWGSQTDLATAPTTTEDVLELDYEDDSEVILELTR